MESVRELKLDRVVAKDAGAPYQGGRTSVWQKSRPAPADVGERPETSSTKAVQEFLSGAMLLLMAQGLIGTIVLLVGAMLYFGIQGW